MEAVRIIDAWRGFKSAGAGIFRAAEAGIYMVLAEISSSAAVSFLVLIGLSDGLAMSEVVGLWQSLLLKSIEDFHMISQVV